MKRGDKEMTFMGHLVELRTRLIRVSIALVAGVIISFVFRVRIFDILVDPAPDSIREQLIIIKMTGGLSIAMKLSLAGGFILAMPVLVHQFIMFVSPALTRREKKYVYLALPWITVLFLGGVAFAYFILVPPATAFLLTFGSEFGSMEPTTEDYISLVTRYIVAVGLVFEIPVIITFLARLGVVKPQWLSKNRRWAIVLAFIAAAIITPTFDPINQSMVAVPMILLYELSIWLAKLAYKKRAEADKDYLSD